MFKIAKSKLPELLKAIAAQQELFLPVNNNGQVNFAYPIPRRRTMEQAFRFI